MQAITTEQRYTDKRRTAPMEGWFNVYEGKNYIGTVHQWPDGRWCYGGREQVAGSLDLAAEALVNYRRQRAMAPGRGERVRIAYPGIDDLVGTVEAEREDVFNGTTHIYVKVSGDEGWHHVGRVRSA